MQTISNIVRTIYNVATNPPTTQQTRTVITDAPATDLQNSQPMAPRASAISVKNENLMAEVEELSAILGDKEKEIEHWKGTASEKSKQVQKLDSQLLYADKATQRAKKNQDAANRRFQELQERLSQVERRNEINVANLERALSVADEERRNITALLETKSAELRQAQVYFTKVDDVADNEVLQLVEKLNSTIYQTAATFANAFEYGIGGSTNAVHKAGERLVQAGLLDHRLAQVLCVADHTEDTILVQIAIQAVMAAYARWLCATWDFRIGGPECFLQHIYRHIKKKEPQSVAGRWRALGRTYVKGLIAGETEVQAIAVELLEKHVADVLRQSGASRTHLAPDDFTAALIEIVRIALEFQRVTGENIVSRDLLAVSASSKDEFDPMRMVDEWADPKRCSGKVAHHPVLCTTHLGLVREETRLSGKSGEQPTTDAVILLKPRVVLTSVLDELSHEQEQKRTAGCV